jgi:hypothetical protein
MKKWLVENLLCHWIKKKSDYEVVRIEAEEEE